MSNLYTYRMKEMQRMMDEHQLDIVLVTTPTNIYFLTGFFSDPHERFMALLINRRSDSCTLFVPLLDLEPALQASFVKDVIPISDVDQPIEMVRNKLGGGIKKVGIEKRNTNLTLYEQWVELFPDAAFSDIENLLAPLRRNKSIEDIARVRHAVEIAQKALDAGVNHVALGVSELEVTAEIEYQMKVLGADRPAFETTVLSGARSALPHGRSSRNKIVNGDFLLFDLGVFVDGYCSDISRTFIIGEGSDEQIKIYQAVLGANKKAIESIKAGEQLGSLDLAAREYITFCGYGPQFIHRVGHGLGLEIHEAPSIHSRNESPIEAGMLFTIEPGVYVPGIGGVRIEDDLYIHKDGRAEVLTSYPKELKNLCLQ